MNKYYILFGPPGAGKGTHATVVTEKFNLRHISTGELLRSEIAAGTELGRHARTLIDAGSLVPDDIVEGMLGKVFDSAGEHDGFLLDGFPRNISQAQDLDRMLAARGEKVNAVIGLMISDGTIMDRIKKRAAIEGRADDASEQTIRHRIETYHSVTEPLIAYYTKAGIYHQATVEEPTIEGNQDILRELLGKI